MRARCFVLKTRWMRTLERDWAIAISPDLPRTFSRTPSACNISNLSQPRAVPWAALPGTFGAKPFLVLLNRPSIPPANRASGNLPCVADRRGQDGVRRAVGEDDRPAAGERRATWPAHLRFGLQ